jgi:cytochrome P450
VFPDKADLVIADANVIKVRVNRLLIVFILMPRDLQEITTYRARFPKPIDYYDSLSFFGANVVASEGEAWKKYRKISSPSFSEVCLNFRQQSVRLSLHLIYH